MAINTRNRRSSAINPQCPWRGQWPAPDSALDQADRQHSLWSYAGILADAPVEPPAIRRLYRPQTAAGPTAYRPLSATLPNVYRPVSPVTPAD